ncbi:hypothetical protein [Rhodococcus sp. USK13]|uniref:hypothetical protein n=1 Tax=Rhodococcus sp. USK13 TaxID=2806442 RepID=UPI001BCAB6B6|nr:hypothetical protein [Rhodococcus sp. USK13]
MSSDLEASKKIDFGRMNRDAWLITTSLVPFQILALADKAVFGLIVTETIPGLESSAVELG